MNNVIGTESSGQVLGGVRARSRADGRRSRAPLAAGALLLLFVSSPGIVADVVDPAPGSTLTSSSIRVRWDPESEAVAYYLGVGTSPEALAPGHWGDITVQALGSRTDTEVFGIPLEGEPVYFRLWIDSPAGWQVRDSSYDTIIGAPDRPAGLTSPLPPGPLSSGARLEWDAGEGVSEYLLTAGTSFEIVSGPPWADLHAYHGTDTSTVLASIPSDGSPVYVRLWSRILSRWFFRDYEYQSTRIVPARIVQPSPGETLRSSSEEFVWDAGSGATAFLFLMATNEERLRGPPGPDIYAYYGTDTGLITPPVIPLTGDDVHVRLWSLIDERWFFEDYRYLTALVVPAEILSPVPGTELDRRSQVFEWTAGTDATEYLLSIASDAALLDDPANVDIFSTSVTGTAVEVLGIPLEGSPVYVRLWSLINGEWFFLDYEYSTAIVVPARILSPAPGSELAQHARRFEWSEGTGATEYLLTIASDPALLEDATQADIFRGRTTGTSLVAVGIPLDGNEIYARLWSLINGEWFVEDASYPTVLSTIPPDPEAECLERGWTKLSFTVGEETRDILWRGPEGAWARGAIVVLHGGGGFSAIWCSYSALTADLLEFTESAVERGFAVFALNSLDDGFTDPWGRECGKRFDFTSPPEVNVDLPYVEEVLLYTIPALRPSGSNEKLFVTGISGGGFMTVRAATHFDGGIAAFAPIAAGDPYGTYIFCDEQDNDVNPGGYLDNETNLPIRTPGACAAEQYPHEREWETESPARRPPFMQLHHLDDGLVDSSCMEKVGELLRQHGYPDHGPFLLGDGLSRSDEAHFWQPEYGPRILSFFESVADE